MWTLGALPPERMFPQTSSAVNDTSGAMTRTRTSSTRKRAVCADRLSAAPGVRIYNTSFKTSR